MKNLFLGLLILLSNLAFSQKIISSKKFNDVISPDVIGITSPYGANQKRIKLVDKDHFIILAYESIEKELITKYNTKLEKQFEITMDYTNYPSRIEYLEAENQIIAIKRRKLKKKEFEVSASLYSGETGTLLTQKKLLTSYTEFSYVSFSDNKQYFIVYYFPKLKWDYFSDPTEVRIFSTSDLALLGSVNLNLANRQELVGVEITNHGDLIAVTYKPGLKLDFEIYDQTGKLKKSIAKTTGIESDQKYGNALYQTTNSGKGQWVCTRQEYHDLKNIEAWEIDYDKLEVNMLFNIRFDKEFIKNILYQRAYGEIKYKTSEDSLKSYRMKGPNYLYDCDLENVWLDKNGNTIIRLEKQSSSSSADLKSSNYSAGTMILLSLDKDGQLNWHTALDRSANRYGGGGKHPYIPLWAGVESVDYYNNNEIGMISFNFMRWGKSLLGLRKFDIKTGELKLAKPLLDDKKVNINANYVEWIHPNMVVLLNMKGVNSVLSENDLTLQVIEITE